MASFRSTTPTKSFRSTTPTRALNTTPKRPMSAANVTGSNYTDSDVEELEVPQDENLPSINERLAYLRPSRELLEYYRKKIAEYDCEHDDLIAQMEQYKMTYEEQHKMQWELRQREEEIAELQKALSDMQVYLFQEREHVLRVYAENDRLKIRELEDRKKIHTLLQLAGIAESEISYFMKEPPARAIVEQKLPSKLQNNLANAGIAHRHVASRKGPKGKKLQTDEEERYKKDNQVLALQVEALQAQLQEQTKLAKEQLDAMLEDRRVRIEEAETTRMRDADKVQLLTEKLHKTQDLLYDSTKDFLTLRYDHRSQERAWMAEKDNIMREMDVVKTKLDDNTSGGTKQRDVLYMAANDSLAPGGGVRDSEEVKALQYQLQQAQKLGDMYREQVIELEDQLSKHKEEGDISRDIFKERSGKMGKRLELMNTRYADLERRRNLEVEGFKNDIKNLRGRLKELEKQLYKVTIGLQEDLNEKRPGDIDMQILRNVRRTAGRSKELVDELKTLKAKVYGMENDLRHL